MISLLYFPECTVTNAVTTEAVVKTSLDDRPYRLQQPPNNGRLQNPNASPLYGSHDHWTTSLASVPSICPNPSTILLASPSAISNPNPRSVLKTQWTWRLHGWIRLDLLAICGLQSSKLANKRSQ
ncbi:hypothetical protein PIB30_015170 [Stylosanthes scabra]|uniref:Uncharacterized protein n=1 Tax=Stylosanthes scabra TaxID=79078 RepID=A0ABU6T6S4_9FABA|nr:hypothetical protein [Stylosanthes scabra]